MAKRRRVTRYVAMTALSNKGRPDTKPGAFHDTTGLSDEDINTLINLGALMATVDSLPNDDEQDEDTNS